MVEFRAVQAGALNDPSAMTTLTGSCSKCGAKHIKRFCSACVLETGLGLLAGDYDGEDKNRPENTPSEAMLTEFGDYDLIEEIGRGGQGVVYRGGRKA